MMPQVEHNALVGAEQLASDVLGAMEGLFPARQGALALHEPEFSGRAEAMVVECIRSTFVSSVGAFVSEFEVRLAEHCGVAHAVAMVNGTAALEVALRVAGVRPNIEVLLPSLTFVATPNAVSHLNAVPHFVDINEHRPNRRIRVDLEVAHVRLDHVQPVAVTQVLQQPNPALIRGYLCPQITQVIQDLSPTRPFQHFGDAIHLKDAALNELETLDGSSFV